MNDHREKITMNDHREKITKNDHREKITMKRFSANCLESAVAYFTQLGRGRTLTTRCGCHRSLHIVGSQLGSGPESSDFHKARRCRSANSDIQFAQAEEWTICILQPDHSWQSESLHTGVTKAMSQPGAFAHLLVAKRGPIAQANLFVVKACHLD